MTNSPVCHSSFVIQSFVINTHWGVQDSNLRRQSHQIYSLTRLTASVTPRATSNSPTSATWRTLHARHDEALIIRSLAGYTGRQRLLAVRPIDPKPAALFTYYELAGGLEPSTC